MRRLFGILCVLVLLNTAVFSVRAQDADPPEYTAFSIARLLSADGTQVEAEFLVSNIGGAAAQPANVELSELGSDVALAAGLVPALGAGETYELLLSFPVNAFPDAEPEVDNVVFELLITSPEFNPVRRLAEFTIPAVPDGTVQQPAQTATQTPNEIPAETGEDTIPGQSLIDLIRSDLNAALESLPFEVDLSSPVQLAGALAVIAVVVLLVWLITVLFRLMFVSRPSFPPNPPPYVGMPQMHPDSIPGRRQMWQQVAQHGSMMADTIEGNLHARKLLTDTAGNRFSGWKAVGIRASQYDTYGRVNRTQIIVPDKILRGLNRALSRAESLTEETAKRRVKSTANYIAGQLNRRINKRGAALPIAMDIKFRGEHGEVNIRFELYQYQLGAWRELDRWQPEMTVPGKYIYEVYTFTLHGIQSNESMRQFRKRLREDMRYLLAEMVLCAPPVSPSSQQATHPHIPPIAAVITEQADTQNNMQPVSADSASFAAPTTNSMRPVPPPQEDSSLMDTMTHPTNNNGG